jgi:hypothetical protein
MQLLESSINILDTGVHDYPRLSKVLQTTRVRLFQTKSKPNKTKQTSQKTNFLLSLHSTSN